LGSHRLKKSKTKRGTPRKHGGFTLAEFVTTLAIMAVVTAMTLPNLINPLVEMRLSTVASQFANTLTMARSEAQRQRAVVLICPRSAQNGCTNNASNWNQGWFMFVDTNTNDQFDANETILQVHSNLDSRTTLSESNQAPLIKMDATGATMGLSSGIRTFKLTDSGTRSVARYVVLDRTSRARVLTDSECKANTSGCTP